MSKLGRVEWGSECNRNYDNETTTLIEKHCDSNSRNNSYDDEILELTKKACNADSSDDDRNGESPSRKDLSAKMHATELIHSLCNCSSTCKVTTELADNESENL